jgi:hypothetical protein
MLPRLPPRARSSAGSSTTRPERAVPCEHVRVAMDGQHDDYLYEGFKHDPAWYKVPKPGYLDGTVSDLRRLPQALQDDAVLVDVGESSWSRHLIETALNALADLGRPLRHLYYVVGDGDDGPGRSQQIANAMEDDVEATRQRMLDSLTNIPDGERGVIVWQVTTS